MEILLSTDHREIRVTRGRKAHVLSFKHPKYQLWWVCLCVEYLRPNGKVEFARVIFAF